MDRTHNGEAFRMLTVIDERSHQCLAIHDQRKLKSDDVLAVLIQLLQQHGPPDHIRSDNRAELTAHAVSDWLDKIGVKMLYIEPGSQWENRSNKSFNDKLRDELLNGRNLLYPKGSGHPDRALAHPLPHHEALRIARMQAANSTNELASHR